MNANAASLRTTTALVGILLAANTGLAQRPVHYQHRADMPPGAVGQLQLTRGGPLEGYFQPVEVRGPKGTLVALAADGDFAPAQDNKALAGMLIGNVYRLRVGNIAGRAEAEVFPSIEVVDRLYPPPGQETRFPIPIEITAEDLALAAEGKFVTRVIYLEDPRHPLPVRELPNGEQRVVDSQLREDPLRVADQYGRPMAILRIGSRVPLLDAATGKFLFECPPLQIYAAVPPETTGNEALEDKPAEVTGVEERSAARYPRLPANAKTR